MDGRRARSVLDVALDAGPVELRRAFRARVHTTHPDHGGTDAAFAEVAAAFETLRDAPSRRRVLSLPRAAARVDVYDSPRPAGPRRDFADALRAALMRQ